MVAARHLEEPPPLGFVARFNTVRAAAEMGLRPIIGRSDGTRFIPAVPYADGLPSHNVQFATAMVQAHPHSDRVGLIMGPCPAGNVFAFDLDRNHGNGDGVAAMRQLLDELGIDRLPHGPRVLTPRGGVQIILRAPDGVVIRRMTGRHAIAPAIDCLGLGALMTIPPTVRADGAYKWVDGVSLFTPKTIGERATFIPFAPRALIELVEKRPGDDARPTELVRVGALPPRSEAIAGESDHDKKERERREQAEEERKCAYIACAIDGLVRDVATAPIGARNSTLNWAAAKLAMWMRGDARGRVNEDVVLANLRQAAAQVGLSVPEANSAVRSGLTYGRSSARNPLSVPHSKNDQRAAGGPRAGIHTLHTRNATDGATPI